MFQKTHSHAPVIERVSILRTPAVRISITAIAALMLFGCNDSTTQPGTNPNPPADTATYDLVFEQSAFPLNASDIRIRRKGETDHKPLFNREMFGIEPTASADGRTVVYQGYGANDQDNSDLWLVRDGQAPQRIAFPIGDSEFAPALSPDASHIAFVRFGVDGNTQLWVAKIDGTDRRKLSTDILQGAASASGTPEWSPDGQRIAWAFGTPGVLRINIINVDGTGQQVVSAGVTNGMDIDVDWSPDAKQIAFVRMPSPATSDLVVRTLATGAERVFGLARRTRQPAWAHDGKSIVFASTMADDGTDYELYSVKPNGADLVRLTNDELNQKHPLWLKR